MAVYQYSHEPRRRNLRRALLQHRRTRHTSSARAIGTRSIVGCVGALPQVLAGMNIGRIHAGCWMMGGRLLAGYYYWTRRVRRYGGVGSWIRGVGLGVACGQSRQALADHLIVVDARMKRLGAVFRRL